LPYRVTAGERLTRGSSFSRKADGRRCEYPAARRRIVEQQSQQCSGRQRQNRQPRKRRKNRDDERVGAEIDGRANGLDAEIGAILPLTVARPPEHPVAVEIPRQSYGGGERQRARRVVVPLPTGMGRGTSPGMGVEPGEPAPADGT